MNATLQTQFGTSFNFLQKNLEGFEAQHQTQAPAAGGNSAAWLLSQMPLVFGGQQPLWDQTALNRWARSPAKLEANEQIDWVQLHADLGKSQGQLMAFLGNLTESDLERPTPAGPLGGTLAFLATHEAYHVGQLAMLRRNFGLPGMLP
jgi:hypothetical protein